MFLEGDSGAGKSALLQAGLVPSLKNSPELLPIYVESLAGADWERDPRRFLAAGLWTALDEGARVVLALKVPPTSDAVYPVTAAIPEKLGRLPLIILDQFDDHRRATATASRRARPGSRLAGCASRTDFGAIFANFY